MFHTCETLESLVRDTAADTHVSDPLSTLVPAICDEEALDIVYLAHREPYAYRVLRALGGRPGQRGIQVGEHVEPLDVFLLDPLMTLDLDAASVAVGLLSKFGAFTHDLALTSRGIVWCKPLFFVSIHT